ncbi:MAG: Maf family protein [Gemmobacter sp.]
MSTAAASTPPQIVLASASDTRAALLRAAGVEFAAVPARIDEETAIAALAADGVAPREIADALAAAKAQRVAARDPAAVVIGCDQVLDLDGAVMDKATSIDAVRAQVQRLRGRRHSLHSAVVVFHNGNAVWRHVEEVRLTMRLFSDEYREAYLVRHAARLVGTAGGYRIEEEGVRLFARIDGDHAAALGLPLLPLLGYLGQRGWIAA